MIENLKKLRPDREAKEGLIELACVALLADGRSTTTEQKALNQLIGLQTADNERLLAYYEKTISALNSGRIKAPDMVKSIGAKIKPHDLRRAALDFLHTIMSEDRRVSWRESELYAALQSEFGLEGR